MMKNIRNLIFIAAALLTLTNASVWEGAAAAAPLGDLPDEGYYAATNSFPRNTVVDILNLETGKSIRVIVAAGLDTPGLLAVLSREAAASIGLQSRLIGRIRMTQPSDPIAFSRFTEGLATSGDPDYDPQAMVAADSAGKNAAKPGTAGTSAPAKQASPSAVETRPTETYPVDPYLGYTIVDIPDGYSDPAIPAEDKDKRDDYYDYWDSPAENKKSEFAGADDSPESTLYPIWAEGGSVGIVDIPEPDPSASIAEAPEAPGNPSPNSGAPWLPTEGAAAPPSSGPLDLSLIPAEQRPPDSLTDFEIPPEAFIGPIEQQPPAQAQAPNDYLDESLFIGPIERDLAREASQVQQPVQAQPPAPDNSLSLIDESRVIPPIPDAAPAPMEDPVFPGSEFSVPLISKLERGKYYLQLGAFNQAASVEDALTKLDKAFPLAVLAESSAGEQTYRILIGPVNQGESGALLQRFKHSGYGDAFVKSQ
ncbi:lipoprotein [Spirochaetia bacterium]|nr:lipoprotein [Spirochaetia bacterium]